MKEYSDNNRPFLHLYIEIQAKALVTNAISKEILREHLETYFRYFDNDYRDLKRILGIEPLEITVVRCGTFTEYTRRMGKTIEHINPTSYNVTEFLGIQEDFYAHTQRRIK